MKTKAAHHLSEHTYVYEFHHHVCTHKTNSEPNFHKNLEILLVLEGSCSLFIGERVYTVNQGEGAFIMPFRMHHFEIEEGGRVICTTFHESLVKSLYETIKVNRPTTPVFTPTRETYDYFSTQMISLFGNNSGELKTITPPVKRLKVKGLLYALESEFLEQAEFECASDLENTATMVLNYISENFKENISLKDIAANIGYNYQYVSRTFNDMIGMSFKKLLNLYRMEYAYALLQDTDKQITDIAYESGFQSVRSLYRVCLEIYGCSPVDLRKRKRSFLS